MLEHRFNIITRYFLMLNISGCDNYNYLVVHTLTAWKVRSKERIQSARPLLSPACWGTGWSL